MTQTAGDSPDLAEPPSIETGRATRLALDSMRLMEHVEIICGHRGISVRKAAAEMGVPADTLTRMKREGMVPGGDAIASIFGWMHTEPSPYLVPRAERQRKSA
jgi:hypothetical protein